MLLRVGRRTIVQKSVRLKPFMEASLRKQSLAFELLSSLIPVISPRSVGRSLSECLKGPRGYSSTVPVARMHRWQLLWESRDRARRCQAYSWVLDST